MQVNPRQPRRSFRPGACQKCGGDAYFDSSEESEWWRCLQCGRPLVSYAAAQAEAFSVRADALLQPADMAESAGGQMAHLLATYGTAKGSSPANNVTVRGRMRDQ